MSAFDDALESDLRAADTASLAARLAHREAERRELFQQFIAPIFLDARDSLISRGFPRHRGLERDHESRSNSSAVRGWPLGKWFLDELGGMRGIRVGADWRGFREGKRVIFSVTTPIDVYRERVHIVDGNPWRLDTSYSDSITDRPVEWEVRQLLVQNLPLLEQNALAHGDLEQQ